MVFNFKFGDLFVNPLWVNEVEDAVNQFLLVVLRDVHMHIFENIEDALHVLDHELGSKQSQNGDRSLIKYEDSVQKVKIPDM